MKIGAMGSMAAQPANNNSSQVVDTESKQIQAQITNAQNKLQQITSNQNMSDEEKSRLRQEIQKQISELNNQLRKHQLEMRQQQQQAADTRRSSQDTRQTEDVSKDQDAGRIEDSRRNQEALRKQDNRKAQDNRRAQEARRADDARAQDLRRQDDARQMQDARRTEDIRQSQDTGRTQDNRQTNSSIDKSASDNDERRTTDIPAVEMKAVISADNAVKHASRQGQVSSSISSKARVLEGEIRQDSRSERNTKSKQAELETLERKAAATSSAQMSILSDASGEVRRVNVRDNVDNNINRTRTNNNQAQAAQNPAKTAARLTPDYANNKGKVDAYSKGRMFSSVNFSF